MITNIISENVTVDMYILYLYYVAILHLLSHTKQKHIFYLIIFVVILFYEYNNEIEILGVVKYN